MTADPRPWPTEPVEMYTWYSFRWGVSPRMNESLDDWAELNYDWPEHKGAFKTRRDMIHKFMWDAVWHQFNNWRREWDEMEAQSAADDKLTEREKELSYWDPAANPAEALRDILNAGFVPESSPYYARAQAAIAAEEERLEKAEQELAEQGVPVLPALWLRMTKVALLEWLDAEAMIEMPSLRRMTRAQLQTWVRESLVVGELAEHD